MIARQKGYVLLQVMFVFAILSVILAQISYKQRIQVKRTEDSLFLSQAQVYAESVEAFAEVGLSLDQSLTDTDHLYEKWNQAQAFPFGDTEIKLQLDDLQGRFNVNWLSPDSGYRDSALKAFKKLLATISANNQKETEVQIDAGIADELFKWLDPDSGIDFDYNDQKPSYSPSFRQLSDLSELLLLKSVGWDEYEVIKPFLSALPADSALNINTAPVEIIQSIASFIDEAEAKSVVTDRDKDSNNENSKAFTAVTDLTNRKIFKENEGTNLYLNKLAVTSQWFEFYSAVKLDGKTLTQRSVLFRDSEGNVSLTLRDRSAKNANPIPGDPSKKSVLDSQDQDDLENDETEQ